ncbi:MAG TPA: exonuclease domain-containing protein, partial [Burkholderiales bacterium]
MAQDQNNLLWLDMEMTGLDPDRDLIIEIAIVVTDSQLNTVSEAPVLVVRQP